MLSESFEVLCTVIRLVYYHHVHLGPIWRDDQVSLSVSYWICRPGLFGTDTLLSAPLIAEWGQDAVANCWRRPCGEKIPSCKFIRVQIRRQTRPSPKRFGVISVAVQETIHIFHEKTVSARGFSINFLAKLLLGSPLCAKVYHRSRDIFMDVFCAPGFVQPPLCLVKKICTDECLRQVRHCQRISSVGRLFVVPYGERFQSDLVAADTQIIDRQVVVGPKTQTFRVVKPADLRLARAIIGKG